MTGRRTAGFTIVELLIVIVVIGILAAITIVAYNGVQDRAHAATAQSDATNLVDLLGVANSSNGTYPSDLSTINNGSPLPTADGTTYAYHPGSGNTSYCATVTNGKSSYKVADTAMTPVSGGCPGDGQGGVAAITNLIANPSAENGSTSPNEAYYSVPLTVDTTTAVSGSSSILLTTNSTTNAQGMMWKAMSATAGATYTCSVSIKGTAGAVVQVAGRANDSSGTYIGEGYGSKNVTLSTSWQRVSVTYTAPANTGQVYIQYHLTTAQSGISIWGDAAMCTQGSTLYNYADGNTTNWIWNGTANNSTSTGPAP